MTSIIWYEQPLNERIRTLLRLEHLFNAIDAYFIGDSPWQVRACAEHIIHVFSLLQRSDFKTEVIKELERNIGVLASLKHSPGVDHEQLDHFLQACHQSIGMLHQMSGMVGQQLKENELFMAMVQRSAIEGGTSNFDLPTLHYWLNLPVDIQQKQLLEWQRPFLAINSSTRLILKLLRESAYPEELVTENGTFQRSLPKDNSFQLIQVGVDTTLSLMAEISGNKQHIAVRFLVFEDTQHRPKAGTQSIPFKLKCCGL